MNYVNINGELIENQQAKVHISDLGLRRGYGVFEFFRVLQGIPVFLEDHLTRFKNSSRAIDLELLYSRTQIEGFIHELISLNKLENAGIQLILTGGYSEDGFTPGEPNLIISPIPLRSYSAEQFEKGLKIILHQHLREIPQAKTTAYLTAVKMGKRMKAEGAGEVVYHDGNYVSEAARSSLAFIKSGVLVTAKEGILPGITRLHVLRLGKELMPVEERAFTLDKLLGADEVLLTSSSKGVMPVTRIEDRPVADGKVGPYTKALMNAFKQHLEAYLRSHQR